MSCTQANCNEPPSLFPVIPLPVLLSLCIKNKHHAAHPKSNNLLSILLLVALLLYVACRNKSTNDNGANGGTCPPPEPCPPCPPIPVPETRQFLISTNDTSLSFLQMTSHDSNAEAFVIGTRFSLLNVNDTNPSSILFFNENGSAGPTVTNSVNNKCGFVGYSYFDATGNA